LYQSSQHIAVSIIAASIVTAYIITASIIAASSKTASIMVGSTTVPASQYNLHNNRTFIRIGILSFFFSGGRVSIIQSGSIQ
jgi:hypothetical protein